MTECNHSVGRGSVSARGGPALGWGRDSEVVRIDGVNCKACFCQDSSVGRAFP
ncbi:MAG: hypothetical protein PHN69_00910 [Candidatus Pacebacteria bacterium]|nr:hypothetical protein [Candidatus Paceibacterota bacterium]